MCIVLLSTIDCFLTVFPLNIDYYFIRYLSVQSRLFIAGFLPYPYLSSARCPDFTIFVNASAVTLFFSIYTCCWMIALCKLTVC